MTVTISGSSGITGPQTDNDVVLNGVTVGLGAGSVSSNTVVGASGALGVNTSGANDVAVGAYALQANTTGSQNVGIGQGALYANTTGSDNTAIGFQPLAGNTTGGQNVAIGRNALASNTTASNNTAVGYQAGYSNTTGQVTFIGNQAGYNSTGYGNTAIGHLALYSGTTGYTNGAFGRYALNALTTGINNTAVGGNNSGSAITTGNANTILGNYSGNQGGLDIRTANNYIVLSDGDGNPQFYITNTGASYTSTGTQGPYNNTTANAANMWIGSSGILGRSTSALKYKTNVRDLPEIDITKFRPVVYNSNCEGDDKTVDHFGFIADEVDQAGYKQLVSYGAQGEVEGFQYERMTVVLTQQVQSLLATVNAQATTIATMQAQIATLTPKS